VRILETYYSVLPQNYSLAVAYIKALTLTGDYGAARRVATRAITLRSDNPRLFRLLGRIEELAGNPAESHRLLAEAYVAEGQLHPAIQQLEIALRKVDKADFQQVARIESRLKTLRKTPERKAQEKSR
jgi:predicted Zn-dependent protease